MFVYDHDHEFTVSRRYAPAILKTHRDKTLQTRSYELIAGYDTTNCSFTRLTLFFYFFDVIQA